MLYLCLDTRQQLVVAQVNSVPARHPHWLTLPLAGDKCGLRALACRSWWLSVKWRRCQTAGSSARPMTTRGVLTCIHSLPNSSSSRLAVLHLAGLYRPASSAGIPAQLQPSL